MTRRFPTGLSALTHRRRVSTLALLTVVVLVALLLAGRGDSARPVAARHTDGNSTDRTHRDTREPRGTVTLAFAGDLHFQLHLAALLDHPVGALGPITQTLSDADLTMVNLESAITDRGTPEAKLLETPADRFHFRTSPAALDVLDEAGVDVVTMANNHGADYGPVGVTDTLRAIRRGPVAVVGIGRDRRAAFAPYRTTVGDTDLAFLAADASFREDSSSVWEAGASNPGLAAAHSARPRDLLDAVKSASAVDDIVVVYLHWGEEGKSCPTRKQQITASALAEAGADVVVGSHAHQLLGSGWLGDTYVNYGLGNFLWYSANEPETGVLEVVVRDGRVVGDSWHPARIQTFGRPLPLRGQDRAEAITRWHRLRACAGLSPRPSSSSSQSAFPPYRASIERLGPASRAARPGCPVPGTSLRLLRLSHVGFDDAVHTGELVVHKRYADGIVHVFRELYEARWPIRQMRPIDEFDGSDRRSMAADNTSGYNCRRVAGRQSWSAHAYGAAIDINPLENPDLSRGLVAPPAGRSFADLDRRADSRVPSGVLQADDVVVRAFAAIGWEWGGDWSPYPDYQHFTAR